MPNVRDHDASVYLRLQGDALSVGGYEANPVFWEEVRDEGSGEGLGLSEEKCLPRCSPGKWRLPSTRSNPFFSDA